MSLCQIFFAHFILLHKFGNIIDSLCDVWWTFQCFHELFIFPYFKILLLLLLQERVRWNIVIWMFRILIIWYFLFSPPPWRVFVYKLIKSVTPMSSSAHSLCFSTSDLSFSSDSFLAFFSNYHLLLFYFVAFLLFYCLVHC